MKIGRFDLAAVILFGLFISAPLGALAVFGATEPYGGKSFQSLHWNTDFFESKPVKRDSFVQSVLDRSWVRKAALKSYNWVSYSVFHSVNTDQIISGKDGWLFYKGQFRPCVSDDAWTKMLVSVKISTGLARAAGIDLTLSISPNKSSLYPEMLRPKDRVLTGCAEYNAQRWRTLAKQEGSQILDHLPSLQALKNRQEAEGESQPVYLETDTHWRSSAMPEVIGDVLRRFGSDPTTDDEAVLHVASPLVDTDLYNAMLVQSRPSKQPSELAVPLEPEPRPATFIVHDSFYNRFKDVFYSALNVTAFYHISHDRRVLPEALRHYSGRLLVNSVERDLLQRFGDSKISRLNDILGPRLGEVAKDCSYEAVSPDDVLLSDVTAAPDFRAFEPTGPDPILAFELGADGKSCLRVTIDVDRPAILQFFLPPLPGDDPQPEFEENRSLIYPLDTGSNEVALVIPPEFAGQWRLDPVDRQMPFTLERFEIGVLPNLKHDQGNSK